MKINKPICHRYFIRDKETGNFVNVYGLPLRAEKDMYDELLSFPTREDAENHMQIDQLPNHEVVKVGFVICKNEKEEL